MAAAFNEPDNMAGDDHQDKQGTKEKDFLTFEQRCNQSDQCRPTYFGNQDIKPRFINRMGKIEKRFPFFSNGNSANGYIDAAFLKAFQLVADTLACNILKLSVYLN